MDLAVPAAPRGGRKWGARVLAKAVYTAGLYVSPAFLCLLLELPLGPLVSPQPAPQLFLGRPGAGLPLSPAPGLPPSRGSPLLSDPPFCPSEALGCQEGAPTLGSGGSLVAPGTFLRGPSVACGLWGIIYSLE